MDVVVKGLDPGSKYILQARSISKDGKQSPWSNSFRATTISDTTAPSPVTSLVWVVNKAGFHATWTKPTTDSDSRPLKDFNGYEITLTANSISKKYISMQEVFDFTLDQNVNAFGAPEPVVQISVKTRDIMGNLSSAATATATNPVPADLTGLNATGIPLAIFLDWDDTVEDDFKCYEIYMSTSGSGFTPGPSNLIATTYSSQFSFPTTSIVPHYFKVRQVDLFNQGSNYSSVTGEPLDTTDLDTTPPDAPANIAVTTTANSAGSSSIAVSWDASTSTNLGGYVVRYSTDEVTWKYINVPADSTSTIIGNLVPSVAYYVSVASVSFVSSYSAWIHAGTYPITTAADTTAPSTPSIPTVSFNTQTVQVSHNMTKSGGGNLEADVRYLEVHASTTSAFTSSSATLIGTLDAAGQGITVVGNFPVPVIDSVTNMYWRVKAVDYAGNKSTQSAQATGLPGLIQGANIANATIADAKIGSLSAAKLVAGTAFVNNLSVQSQLTLDASTGYIASTNFSIPSKTGWRLDQNGLVIYDGSISAKSLLLQNGNNLTPPPFADFEFNADYYFDSSNTASVTTMTATSGMLLDMLYTGVKTGKQSLRLWNTAITGSTVHKLHFATAGDSATGVNIDVNPGDYIVSIWAKKNGAVNQTLKFGLYPDTGSAIESSGISVTSSTWTRYSAVLTIPSGVSKVKQYISLQAVTTGYDIVIDALQLEPKLTAETAPSAWKPPGTTVIDGGSIITGSIRSSAASATVPGQPAWSINTAGNMQIGDALVRGKLIMGLTADSRNFVPKDFASWENAASFYYNTSTNFPNLTNMDRGGVDFAITKLALDTTGTPPHGTNGLRMYALSGATASSSTYIYAGGDTNFALVPGQQYIFSFYVKNNDGTKGTKVEVGLWNHVDGNVPILTAQTITTSYVRYSAIFTAPATPANQFYIGVMTQAAETAFDVTWDAIQIEAAPVDTTTPSAFTDGTIGISSMASANYIAGSQGWTINSDGTAEFNNTTIRGGLQVTGSAGTIKTDITSSYPTIFFYAKTGGQYGFINSAGGGNTKAFLGVNSSQFSATTGGHTIRPRVWMPDKIRIENVDESTGSYQGGQAVFDETSVDINAYDASNILRTKFNLANDGTWAIDSLHSTGLYNNIVAADSSGIGISHFQAGVFKSGAVFDDNIVRLYTKNGFFLDLSGTSGFLIRTPGGTWTNLTLGNGWTNLGSPYNSNAGYRMTPDGFVRLRGVIVGGTKTDGTVIATLPTGYRPTADQIIAVGNGTSGGVLPNIRIRAATGNIEIFGMGASTNGTHSWDNVSFPVT